MIARPLAILAASAALVAADRPPAEQEPASPVRLNQVGLLARGAKRAIVPNASRAPLAWQLLDGSGAVRAKGRTRVFGADRASGEHLHIVDFSAFSAQGTGYRLRVGNARSRAFSLSDRIYDGLQIAALRYFFHNRAGMPIEARFAGGAQWARPAGHSPERATCVAGTDGKGNNWPGCDYTLDVTGGWYDAGDHGKYVVNGGIALWTLLSLHERRQQRKAPSPFADGRASLPESGNGVDDLLDEARWEMEFLLKMQAPAGARAQVPVAVSRSGPGLPFTEIDSAGMAHHKVADEQWTALPLAPHEDKEKRQLFPVSTGATLNLAATAAQCARAWRTVDPAFAERCLAAAERAYAAAKRNPSVYPVADFAGSGGYGDNDFSDEFYWAAAELLATTGKAEYARDVRASPHFRAPIIAEHSWPGVAPIGTITLASVPGALPPSEAARLRGTIVAAANRFLKDGRKVGYGIPYDPPGYPWGSNGAILNRAMLLALAHDYTGRVEYRDGVIAAMDYVLGRNPVDRSYVSGYGARPMLNPHHRFWARQASAAYPPPPPGALSGGPNSLTMTDDVAPAFKGKCAPQTCYLDDYRAFSLNEVAINWNAPLLWVAAWLAEPRQGAGNGRRR